MKATKKSILQSYVYIIGELHKLVAGKRWKTVVSAPIYPEEKYKTLATDVRNSLLNVYHATFTQRQGGTVLCKKKKKENLMM